MHRGQAIERKDIDVLERAGQKKKKFDDALVTRRRGRPVEQTSVEGVAASRTVARRLARIQIDRSRTSSADSAAVGTRTEHEGALYIRLPIRAGSIFGEDMIQVIGRTGGGELVLGDQVVVVVQGGRRHAHQRSA